MGSRKDKIRKFGEAYGPEENVWKDPKVLDGGKSDAEIKKAKEKAKKEADLEAEASAVNSGAVDSVSLYLRSINGIPLLSKEEELELGRQIALGAEAAACLEEAQTSEMLGIRDREELNCLIRTGEAARERMIRSNLRLVVSIAKHYNNCGLPMMDLIQEGNIGLITAVGKYDYTKGLRFSTCATLWIRQSITTALSNTSRTIRVPVYMGKRIKKMQQVIGQFENDHGRTPTDKEIADALGRTVDDVKMMKQITKLPDSLDRMVGEDGDSSVIDFIPDENNKNSEELLIAEQNKQDVADLLSTLTEREQFVLRCRFGFDGRDWTLEEIGNEIGLSRERVRKIEQTALELLRQSPQIDKFR